ncbi:MAG: hypothetical protein V4510_08205 [bacterium]
MRRTPADEPGQDWSTETIAWSIRAQGAFVVAVPLHGGPRATTPGDWLANLTMPAGWSASLENTSYGQVLEIHGMGNGRVTSCSVRPASGGNGCCAEAYMGASWTTDEARGQSFWVDAPQGAPALEMHYVGTSRWGKLTADVAPMELSPGWQVVAWVRGGYIQ